MKLEENQLYGTWLYTNANESIVRTIIVDSDRITLVGETLNVSNRRVPKTVYFDYENCYIGHDGKLYYQTKNLAPQDIAFQIGKVMGYVGTESIDGVTGSSKFILCEYTTKTSIELVQTISLNDLGNSILEMIGDKIIRAYKAATSYRENNKEEVK